jgi:hypothetical protein
MASKVKLTSTMAVKLIVEIFELVMVAFLGSRKFR